MITLQEKKRADPAELNIFDRAKLGVEKLVERVGFFGILVSESFTNVICRRLKLQFYYL